MRLNEPGSGSPLDAPPARRASAPFPLQATTWMPQTSSTFSSPVMDPRFQGGTWHSQSEDQAMGVNAVSGSPVGVLSQTFTQTQDQPSMVAEAVLESPTSFFFPYELSSERQEAVYYYPEGQTALPRTQRMPRQRMRGRLRKSPSSRNDCHFQSPPTHSIPPDPNSPPGSPPSEAALTATAATGDTMFQGGRAAASKPAAGVAGGAGGPPLREASDQQQQYPIRASVQNRALGLAQADPLLEDLTQAGAHLPGSLAPILQKEPTEPVAAAATAGGAAKSGDGRNALPSSIFRGESSLLNVCRGVTGIGGALVPMKGKKAPLRGTLELHIPPATQASPPSSANAQPASAPPRSTAPSQELKQPPTPSSAVKTEPDESGFKTTFQFVVNESTKDARNTVRKHVMREYRRRERWEQERRRTTSDAPGNDSQPTNQKRRRKPTKGSGSVTDNSSLESDAHKALNELYSSNSSGSTSPSHESSKRRRLGDDLSKIRDSKELAAVIPNFEEALEELEKNRDLPYMADPYAAVAASNVDPFSRMQMELGPATRSLMHHFAWVMPSLMDEIVTGTVFNRLGWLYSAVAVHDPKPAHVILGFTLGHIAGLRGQPEPAIATDHKNHAFKLIRDRTADPAKAFSDDNIGAVVNVAGWELIDCNPQMFSLHMDALHKMVVGRGGVEALSHKPELQTVLVRLDAIRAYITLSSPRYPTHACFRTLKPLAINIPASVDNPTVPPMAPEHPEYSFCEDAFHLLHGLEDALLLLRTISKEHAGMKFPASVIDLAHSTVLQCLAPDHVLPSTFAQSRSRRTVRLAALVFVDAAIQHFFDGDAPDSGAKRLAARFLGSRADKNTMAAWGRSLEMVIHVLLAADRLSLERPWRAWYFADALTLTMKLGDDAWAAVEGQLRAYLDERCDEVETLVGARSAGIWNLKTAYESFEAAWQDWQPEA